MRTILQAKAAVRFQQKEVEALRGGVFCLFIFFNLGPLWLTLLELLSDQVFSLKFFISLKKKKSWVNHHSWNYLQTWVIRIEPTLIFKTTLSRGILCRIVTKHLQRSHKLTVLLNQSPGENNHWPPTEVCPVGKCYFNLIAIPNSLGLIHLHRPSTMNKSNRNKAICSYLWGSGIQKLCY